MSLCHIKIAACTFLDILNKSFVHFIALFCNDFSQTTLETIKPGLDAMG